MSERGWQEFVRADGVDEWAVLHGGATAVFEAASFAAAAELAEQVAGLPDAEDAGMTLVIRSRTVSVRLTRDMWHLEPAHIVLAQQVSALARACGALALRDAVQEVQLAIAARPEEIHVQFWRAVLGYAPASDDNAIDALGRGSTVWMQELDDTKDLRHAMHLDVSVPREEAEARVVAALAAGGRIISGEGAPASWILSDAAGNRVCIAAWPDGAEAQATPGEP